jgi:hypothetical protein
MPGSERGIRGGVRVREIAIHPYDFENLSSSMIAKALDIGESFDYKQLGDPY